MTQYGGGQYGTTAFGISELSEEELAHISPDLMEYLPKYYAEIREVIEIQNVIGRNLGGLKYDSQDVLNQFFVDTATWGLARWERIIGVTSDETKPLEHRRSVIKARLRGASTTTKAMLQDVALAYSGGEVEIIERLNESAFTVKFVGTRGIPPNMADLVQTIEDIKPAHLAFDFAFTYLVWHEALAYSWVQASHLSWNELRLRE